MFRSLLTVALLATPIAMAGCDAKLLGAALDAASTATKKVKVTGNIYAPASQVAVVAAGGLNYTVAARSDEKGVKQAKVTFAPLKAAVVPIATAQTDDTGKFTIEVPENQDYVVTATFTAKEGGTVTLTGLAKVTAAAPSVQIDAAHNLVASKLVSTGLSTIDEAKLSTAISQFTEDLSAVSSVPTPTTQSAAASAFDANASATTKATVSGMTK